MHSEAGWAYAATGVKVAAAMHAINSKRVAAILRLGRRPKKKKLASDLGQRFFPHFFQRSERV
jgi:hypothetical protein